MDAEGSDAAGAGGAPQLRYREDGSDKAFTPPVTLIGHVTNADVDVVAIEQARGRTTQLYLEDLAAVLGGPDMALGLMLDAAEHGDQVKIALERQRLSYDNPAQLERYREKAKASG